MRMPSSRKRRLDLAPPLADRFTWVSPSIAARYFSSCPSDSYHGGHPALRSTASGGFRSVLAVSSFRLRARLDLSIPSTFSGQRGYEPRFWISRPSFERQRDFNPPEQCAAQHALPDCRQLVRNPFSPQLASASHLKSCTSSQSSAQEVDNLQLRR